jgi:hypothetical protein
MVCLAAGQLLPLLMVALLCWLATTTVGSQINATRIRFAEPVYQSMPSKAAKDQRFAGRGLMQTGGLFTQELCLLLRFVPGASHFFLGLLITLQAYWAYMSAVELAAELTPSTGMPVLLPAGRMLNCNAQQSQLQAACHTNSSIQQP